MVQMKEILSLSMDIGEEMLRSGAEVKRVEDTIDRICKAYGASRVDAFIITSSMVITVCDTDGEVYTQTRRIASLGTDFYKLDRLNALSRRVCAQKPSVEEAKRELLNIESGKSYPEWMLFVAYAVIAAAFTLFFGGTVMQAFFSLFIGAGVRLMVVLSEKTVKNMILSKLVSAFFVTLCAFLLVRLGLVPRSDEIIIGNIMLLVSGIGFTTALRDLFVGDSVTGILRLLEAVLIAAALAAGYLLVVFLTGGASV